MYFKAPAANIFEQPEVQLRGTSPKQELPDTKKEVAK
jgi:hypothetical protein